MHDKIQLWTVSVQDKAAALEGAGYKVMKRLSFTKSNVALAHVLVAVQGKVWDFVGPAYDEARLQQRGWIPWMPEECPAGHQVI